MSLGNVPTLLIVLLVLSILAAFHFSGRRYYEETEIKRRLEELKKLIEDRLPEPSKETDEKLL